MRWSDVGIVVALFVVVVLGAVLVRAVIRTDASCVAVRSIVICHRGR